jgi:cation diffusion facilitator family transporter
MRATTAGWLSVTVGILVLALKYVAYRLTGSVSLYSDALESVVNVVAATFALTALRISIRPPDENHPFGHSKAEFFSAVAEGVLIVLAALEIVRAAWSRLVTPVALSGLEIGVFVSVLATLANGGLAAFLIRTGRLQRSPALVADGKHLFVDVVTTLGVLAGIGIASLTQLWILDPLIALFVAVNILRVGYEIVKDSVGGLMDVTLPDDKMHMIETTIKENMKGALEVHALRSRHAGRRTFIEFHLVVPENMSVSSAHKICNRLETVIKKCVPGSEITIHVEPEGEAEHRGLVVRSGNGFA